MIKSVTYIASYIVGNSAGTGHKMNKNGTIHNEASSYNEVVQVWTGKTNNSIIKVMVC